MFLVQLDAQAGSRMTKKVGFDETACLREIGLEFVDIIVMSDNEPALRSLIGSWSTMSNKEWMRMIIENSLVGSSKRNGIVERAIQSVQGTIRTIRSAI